MTQYRQRPRGLSRRSVLGILAASTAIASWSAGAAFAQAQEGSVPFSFDTLSEEMRARAGEAFAAPETISGFVKDLTYDQYRQIRFHPERARWADEGSLFQMHAFHLGWLFDQPVKLYQIEDGAARPMEFTTDDFHYRNDTEALFEGKTDLPGVAGFRLHYPLNRPDVFDELVAFQGASYFRALGQGSAYGLSARGLALNTGTPGGEEFPRFSAFYLEKPVPGASEITLYAALDSESVTGAYRFVIKPGRDTVMDVTARLYFRRDVEQLGIAPLTSMFLFAESNRDRFDDYRPQVHDSNGLRIVRQNGDALWRALANPPRLAISYFSESSPHAFGLYQRDRDFEDYQDPEALYEARPSVDVEPVGEWGQGSVRLIEIPSDLEINDNIVAFWTPEDSVSAGDTREFRYLLRWGNLDPDPGDEKAHVLETRVGHGGVSGVEAEPGARKFVVDFAGGALARLPADADVEARVAISKGEISAQTLSKIGGANIWRLVIDAVPEPGAIVELVAHVTGYDQRLSETWLYQWMDER